MSERTDLHERIDLHERTEPFFEALLLRDAGGRSWMPGLVTAAPLAAERLDARLLEDPGSLLTMLGVRGLGGRLGAFEALDPPVRELLGWYVDHPSELERPQDPDGETPEVARLRRALLDDVPPGARTRAQERAHELLATRSLLTRGWWRFENVGRLDCLLQSHRFVLTVVGRAAHPVGPVTPWYPGRSALVRALETAQGMAQGVAWGTVFLSDEPHPEGSPDAVADAVLRGAPHLGEDERRDLAGHYLGNLTWAQLGAAVELDPAEVFRR